MITEGTGRDLPFAEEFVERKKENIICSAFDELMGYVKMYPTQRLNYQESSENQKYV